MDYAGTFTPDDLYNGLFPMVTEARIVPNGTEAFKRGAVLTTANIPVKTATVATVDCIALEDCDASGAAARCVVALSGGFNVNALSTGDATTPASLKSALRAKNIYIAKAMKKADNY
ncbi:MAG: hypothetical protein LBD20_02590 [Spirochaetaceae bacterium]|jgi:hypothetical protein|nr:hypothetical protein [Spirochaetaceae bacterium]